MTRVKVLGRGDYIRLFEQEDGYEVVEGDSYDLLCFTGGIDIGPELYHADRNRFTSVGDRARDTREVVQYRSCVKRGIPMVGICRGAQLLCALNGGYLFQHVNNHTTAHEMKTLTHGTMVVTSSHHQMMDLAGIDARQYQLLGWSDNRGDYYYHEDSARPSKPNPKDAEVAVFPKTKSLAHQAHPEWMDHQAPYRRYFFDTVSDLMEGRYEE